MRKLLGGGGSLERNRNVGPTSTPLFAANLGQQRGTRVALDPAAANLALGDTFRHGSGKAGRIEGAAIGIALVSHRPASRWPTNDLLRRAGTRSAPPAVGMRFPAFA